MKSFVASFYSTLIAVSVLGMFSFPSEASDRSFSGTWAGSGIAITKPESSSGQVTRTCDRVALGLDQNDQALELKFGYYVCEDLQAEYSAAVFQIIHSQLFWQGERVGSITGQKIFIQYLDPEDGVIFRLELEKTDQGLMYLEQWFDKQNRSLFRVKGHLTLEALK